MPTSPAPSGPIRRRERSYDPRTSGVLRPGGSAQDPPETPLDGTFSTDNTCSTISRGAGSIETTMGFSFRSRLLERIELAVQQAARHKMLMTGGDAARNQRFVALEVDQANVRAIPDKNIAVTALQCGACDDAVADPHDASCRSRQRPRRAKATDPHR